MRSQRNTSLDIFLVNIVSIFEPGNPSVLEVKTQSFHQKFLEDERRRRRLLEDEVGRRRRGPPLEMEEVGENQRKNVEGRRWKMFKKSAVKHGKNKKNETCREKPWEILEATVEILDHQVT